MTDINPISVVQGAADALPGFEGGFGGALNILVLLTVLTLAPALLILCTCFTRMVIVMGLLRQAMGTQGMPPSQIIIGLSLFMTFVVMGPTFTRAYEEGVRPYADGEITDYTVAWDRAKQPVRDFMFSQIEAADNWSGAANFLYMMDGDEPTPETAALMDTDFVLHADHGSNASAFTARAVAGTNADLHDAVTAGIGALSGPSHGGAAENVMTMALEIGEPENAKQYVKDLLAGGGRVMGFGHRVYRAEDPRARHLREGVRCRPRAPSLDDCPTARERISHGAMRIASQLHCLPPTSVGGQVVSILIP